ncbi:hypothetical protein [Vineibacter terrae]|uniref:hypothetical protein n=1 Tax=Vineibacter terrae TaxID=2586908 RepID=UPI002E33FE69|nr:hypothetical protein [Vineibacter terrae]HEX2887101.1 hypothetical protein [Vineibacter terrae]
MSRTLDPELESLLNDLAKAGSAQRIPFIVTVRSNVRAREVLPFRIDHEFDAISAASGKMTAAEALKLSVSDAVERVELDGEMHALRRQAGPPGA